MIIEQLTDDGVLEEKAGKWYIGSVAIEDFVKVSDHFTDNMWNE